jgi:hypothetical protein
MTVPSAEPVAVKKESAVKPVYNLHRPDNNEECESCSA